MNKICFREEAKDWNEALPIGNGFIGAMVFGKIGTERLQINEDSVWTGSFMERVNPDARENYTKVRELLLNGEIEQAELLAERSMYATYPHMRHYQTLGDVWIDFYKQRDSAGIGAPAARNRKGARWQCKRHCGDRKHRPDVAAALACGHGLRKRLSPELYRTRMPFTDRSSAAALCQTKTGSVRICRRRTYSLSSSELYSLIIQNSTRSPTALSLLASR